MSDHSHDHLATAELIPLRNDAGYLALRAPRSCLSPQAGCDAAGAVNEARTAELHLLLSSGGNQETAVTAMATATAITTTTTMMTMMMIMIMMIDAMMIAMLILRVPR